MNPQNPTTGRLRDSRATALAAFAGAAIGALFVVVNVLLPAPSLATTNPVLYVLIGSTIGAVIGIVVWSISLVGFWAADPSRFRILFGVGIGTLALTPVQFWILPAAWQVAPAWALLTLIIAPIALLSVGLWRIAPSRTPASPHPNRGTNAH